MNFISDYVFNRDVAHNLIASAIWTGGVALWVTVFGFVIFLVKRRVDAKRTLINFEKDWADISRTINQVFTGKATLINVVRREPLLEILGNVEVGAATKERAMAIASTREQNSKNAVLVDKDDLGRQPPRWRVKIIPHSSVLALREEGNMPNVLSANVLICCSKRNEIYLHHRSDSVDTKKSVFHLFGGSYEHLQLKNDEGSLRMTALRELREESGVSALIPEKCLSIVSTEDDTGFVQLNFCGVEVAPGSVDESKNRFRVEGYIYACPFGELGDVLKESRWAESGKAVVLAWLALGAPTTAKPGFSSKQARRIYQNVMQTFSTETSIAA